MKINSIVLFLSFLVSGLSFADCPKLNLQYAKDNNIKMKCTLVEKSLENYALDASKPQCLTNRKEVKDVQLLLQYWGMDLEGTHSANDEDGYSATDFCHYDLRKSRNFRLVITLAQPGSKLQKEKGNLIMYVMQGGRDKPKMVVRGVDEQKQMIKEKTGAPKTK